MIPKKIKTPIPEDPFEKDDVEEGGPGSGPHSDDEDNPFDTEPSDDDLAAIEKEFEGVVNETLPAYPREWKNLEKACYDLEKAVKILGKSVEKQDRKKGKMIPNIYKTLEASIKKYKNLIQTEILSKLQ